jgi:hypothetical protein
VVGQHEGEAGCWDTACPGGKWGTTVVAVN